MMFTNYLFINRKLQEDLLKSNALVEELRLLVTKQSEAIIDLSISCSSVELIGSTLESRDFEVTKWQNKYIDLVNRNLNRLSTNDKFNDEDKIEAGEEPDKQSLNKPTPWHVRRRQLEREDAAKAKALRTEASIALSHQPITINKLTEAAKELEQDFAEGEPKNDEYGHAV